MIGASASNAIVIGGCICKPDLKLHLLFIGQIKIDILQYLPSSSISCHLEAQLGGHVAHIGGVYWVIYLQLNIIRKDITKWMSKLLDGFVVFSAKKKKIR